jgi:flagellar biosynthesis/type III secretory pathway chaperone
MDPKVSQTVVQLAQELKTLLGLHRQMLELVRTERSALVSADIKLIQENNFKKEAIIEAIRNQDAIRMKLISQLAYFWGRKSEELTVSKIIIQVQGSDLKMADQLRSTWQALNILIERIMDQNERNGELLEKSLEHVNEMKVNLLGEGSPKAQTYTQQGQRSAPQSGARLISKEA